MDLNMDDIELKLLADKPIKIDGVGKIYSPLLHEVAEMGYSKYGEHLSYLLLDEDSFDDELNDEIGLFEAVFISCFQNPQFRNSFLESLKFIFHEQAYLSDVKNGSDAFFYFDSGGRIHRDNFEKVQELIRFANFITKPEKEEEFKPGNDMARAFMEKLKQLKKDAPKPKEKMTLSSIIAGMAWKSKDLNIKNIWDLTIFQLKHGFAVLENIDNYSYTLQAVYAGTIDSKNIKFDKIHWANSIKK